jgi:hypothetical protein
MIIARRLTAHTNDGRSEPSRVRSYHGRSSRCWINSASATTLATKITNTLSA